MVRTLMNSTASLSGLTRPPAKKKAVADEETRGVPNATNENPNPRAEDKDDDDDDDDKGKAKKTKGKAKRAEDKDDDDDDDDNSSARVSSQPMVLGETLDASAVREDERAKIRSILDSDAGKSAFSANPGKAMKFALSWSGTAKDAIATLELFGSSEPAQANNAPKPEPLRERMNANPVPNAGPEGGEGAPNDVVAMILQADKVRRGEK